MQDGVDHLCQTGGCAHVMYTQDIGTAQDADGIGSQAAFQSLLGRQIERIADEGLARDTQQDWETQGGDVVEMVEQGKILGNGLAKANAGVEDDMRIRDASLAGERHAAHQLSFDILEQVIIRHADVMPAQALLHFGAAGGAAVMHEDDGCLAACEQGCHVGVGTQPPDVVDPMCADIQGGFGNAGFKGIDGEDNVWKFGTKRLNDRHDTLHFILCTDRLRARSGGFPADIEDMSTIDNELMRLG